MDRARGRPRSFDPDRVLDAAMRLFWSRGYEGTSVNDLTEATGLAKPSLYAAFGDKQALYETVLDRYASLVVASQRETLESEPDIWRALESLMRHSAASLANPQLPGGCLIVTGLADCGTPNLPGATAQALSRSFVTTKTLILERIARARREGCWPSSVEPESFADALLSFLAGMSVQTKAGADHAALDASVTVMATSWLQALASLPNAATSSDSAAVPSGKAPGRRKLPSIKPSPSSLGRPRKKL